MGERNGSEIESEGCDDELKENCKLLFQLL